jgi:hypothetical protein
MKKIITTTFILSLILLGCSNAKKIPTLNSEINCNELQDHEVYANTANIWVYSWINVLNEIYTEGELAQHSQSSHYLSKRSFDASQVLDYLNTCEDCEQVRIYFVDLHDDSNNLWIVNDLMMVNVKDCKDQIGTEFLVADSAETSLINFDLAKEAVIRKVNNGSAANYPFIKRIYAYTYERDTIIKHAENAQPLNFEFAIHDSHYSESTSTNIMNSHGLLSVDLLLKSNEQGMAKFTDFARPCPELCGIASPFYYLAN